MENFAFILENNKATYYHKMAILIIVINSAALVFFAISTAVVFYKIITFSFVGLFISTFFVAQLKQPHFTIIKNTALIVLACLAWFIFREWVFVFINTALVFLYKIATLPWQMVVNKNGVTIKVFPIKKWAWDEIENIVIKEGLLTIDFKNNKLIQLKTDSSKLPFATANFNQFCNQNILQAYNNQ